MLCLPAGFVLSLLTPLAIKLGLPDVSKTGRVAGLIFALSTLGCLLGNYLTGFVLIPRSRSTRWCSSPPVRSLLLAVGTIAVPEGPSDPCRRRRLAHRSPRGGGAGHSLAQNPYAFPDIRLAYLIVFLASFGGMTLELTASRVLAQYLGVSLFTWTGIIGVMLAGTALGNFTGGLIADRATQPGGMRRPLAWLSAIFACTSRIGLVYQGSAVGVRGGSACRSVSADLACWRSPLLSRVVGAFAVYLTRVPARGRGRQSPHDAGRSP